MKHKVLITPSPLYMSGHAERVLGELGAGPLGHGKDGKIVCQLTDDQIKMWGLKAPAHHLEVRD